MLGNHNHLDFFINQAFTKGLFNSKFDNHTVYIHTFTKNRRNFQLEIQTDKTTSRMYDVDNNKLVCDWQSNPETAYNELVKDISEKAKTYTGIFDFLKGLANA